MSRHPVSPDQSPDVLLALCKSTTTLSQSRTCDTSRPRRTLQCGKSAVRAYMLNRLIQSVPRRREAADHKSKNKQKHTSASPILNNCAAPNRPADKAQQGKDHQSCRRSNGISKIEFHSHCTSQYWIMIVLHASQQQASTLVRPPTFNPVSFTNPSVFLAFSKALGTSFAKLNAPSLHPCDVA